MDLNEPSSQRPRAMTTAPWKRNRQGNWQTIGLKATLAKVEGFGFHSLIRRASFFLTPLN